MSKALEIAEEAGKVGDVTVGAIITDQMCRGAIIQARIGLLVYGADDPKTGTIRTVANLPDSACSNHRLEVIAGIRESACREQLQSWFQNKRQADQLS